MTFLQRALERPAIFNLIQWLVSANQIPTKRAVAAALAAPAGERVLDVGCGTGDYAGVAGGSYLGVDINPAYIHYAAANRGTRFAGRFLVSDIRNLPLPDQAVERSMYVNCMHHLDDRDNLAVLREMRRVTRGTVLIIDMVGDERHPLKRLFLALDRGRHLRGLAAQLALVRQVFEVRGHRTFDSGWTPQTLIVAGPATDNV